MTDNAQNNTTEQEKEPFWKDWLDQDWINDNLIWQVPLFGGGLWFLSTMLFGDRKREAQQGGTSMLSFGLLAAGAAAVWYFFIRTKDGEQLDEMVREQAHFKTGPDATGIRGYDAEYQQAFNTVQSAYGIQLEKRGADKADQALRARVQDAIADLKDPEFYIKYPQEAAMNDAYIDLFMMLSPSNVQANLTAQQAQVGD